MFFSNKSEAVKFHRPSLGNPVILGQQGTGHDYRMYFELEVLAKYHRQLNPSVVASTVILCKILKRFITKESKDFSWSYSLSYIASVETSRRIL